MAKFKPGDLVVIDLNRLKEYPVEEKYSRVVLVRIRKTWKWGDETIDSYEVGFVCYLDKYSGDSGLLSKMVSMRVYSGEDIDLEKTKAFHEQLESALFGEDE